MEKLGQARGWLESQTAITAVCYLRPNSRRVAARVHQYALATPGIKIDFADDTEATFEKVNPLRQNLTSFPKNPVKLC
jgi:hypothetical protein